MPQVPSVPTPAPDALPRAWSPTELANPHAAAEKADKVRNMFGAIAHSYDLNNRVHSMWRDQAWRRFAVRQAGPAGAGVVVDVACGTGDLTEAFARRGGGVGQGAEKVIGIDFTPQMLEIAEQKRQRLPSRANPDRIEYRQGDAQELPLPDASADVVSIAFGIRNVADPDLALRQFRRVLRPGGVLVILEFGRPRLGLVRWLNEWYCKRLMPCTATLLSGDRTGAYRYLPASVETFLTREELCTRIRGAGFAEVTATDLSLGICVCYRALAGPAPR